MSKELQRRGEDLNLRRQEYWRSGLLLLARCIKPLCHLSLNVSATPSPNYKTSLFRSFLVVMFSASKIGGSRGSTSYSFRAGTPLLHTSSEGPARLLFLSPGVS